MLTTAITALLASATFIWIASIIIFIAMMIFLENEKEGWATTLFSLGIALFLWNFRTEIWATMSSNPTATIGFAVTYVLIGIAWSFMKWRTYVKDIFNRFKELKADFIRTNGPISGLNLADFNETVENADFKNPDGYRINSMKTLGKVSSVEEIVNKIAPLASKKKTVITAWVSYWPVSFAGTLLNNPFRQFFEWIYNNLSGYYDKITNVYQKDAIN